MILFATCAYADVGACVKCSGGNADAAIGFRPTRVTPRGSPPNWHPLARLLSSRRRPSSNEGRRDARSIEPDVDPLCIAYVSHWTPPRRGRPLPFSHARRCAFSTVYPFAARTERCRTDLVRMINKRPRNCASCDRLRHVHIHTRTRTPQNTTGGGELFIAIGRTR